MHEINEKVDVLAVSKKGQGLIAPIKIRWRGRYYSLKEIGLIHPKREGRSLYHIVEGSDGNLNFRLRYDTETMQWTLETTSDGLPQ